MRNLVKNKKKKGFTLIEMVAVVAIIGILAAILVPKITGYINEAKKTAVIDQARKVSQAYEAAKMKDTLKIKGVSAGLTIKTGLDVALKNDAPDEGNITMKSLIADEGLKNLGGKVAAVTVEHCVAITNGSDFEIDDKQVLKPATVDLTKASK